MKHLIFSLAMLFAAAVVAQPKEPARPEAAKPEPVKAEAAKATPVKQAALAKKGPRRWNEDARHCLELGSNTEIIKCAEEFF